VYVCMRAQGCQMTKNDLRELEAARELALHQKRKIESLQKRIGQLERRIERMKRDHKRRCGQYVIDAV